MKQLKLGIKNLSVVQVAVVILVTGVFFGILFANTFQNFYQEQLLNYQYKVFSDIRGSDIDYSSFFFYVLGKNFKEFLVFWVMCVTILGIPYMAYKIATFGFFAGFFISTAAIEYGLKGLLLVLVYVFPHGLLYLPVALLSLYKGFTLCRSIYNENRYHFHSIFKLLKSQLFLLIILAVVLLAGSFLEAYVGAFLLKKTLGLYV